jgi:AraC-like DNA-binding protein
MHDADSSVLPDLDKLLEDTLGDFESGYESDDPRHVIVFRNAYQMTLTRYFAFYTVGKDVIGDMIEELYEVGDDVRADLHESLPTIDEEATLSNYDMPPHLFSFLTSRLLGKTPTSLECKLRCDLALSMLHSTQCEIACEADKFQHAVFHLVEGARHLGMFLGSAETGGGDQSLARFSQKGVQKMLSQHPKQADKKGVKEYWERWQKNPHLYPSVAEFGRDMLEKFESLKSPEVIARWVRIWKKALLNRQSSD